jgi:hypothetical protein
MSLIDKVRKMFGGGELPDEVSPLYRGAKNEREALILLKEARRRDESRRRRAMQDLEVLDQMEEELLEEGKSENGENRRLLLARRIKEIRQKMEELNNRIESIYNRRIKVFNEHVNSLETILELEAEPLPDRKSMEDLAIKARERLEDLEKATELAEGMRTDSEAPQPDEEEAEILREMEARADVEIAKHEIEKDEPEPRERETKEKVKAEKETDKVEKKATEKKAKEKKEKEKPEILFEE